LYFSIHIKDQTRVIVLSDERPGMHHNDEDDFVVIANPESQLLQEEEKKEESELDADADEDYKSHKLFEQLRRLSKPSVWTKVTVSRIIISLIGKVKESNNEIMAVYLDTLETTMMQKGTGEDVYELYIDRVQLDNQGQREPMFPTILRPRCILKEDLKVNGRCDHKLLPKTVFVCAKLRSDVENITYVTVFNFLIQELEVNIELNYLLSLLDFVGDVTTALGSAMTTPHPAFGRKVIENS
jgi:hypothetical protein